MKYQVCRDLTPIEYEALRNDVAENGVLVPVEIDENGDILDGHHRIKAWQELTSEGATLPDYARIIRAGMTEEQKRNHARKLNVLRRHMGKEEREQMMVDMRKDGMSYRQIAQATGVSKNTAQRTIESSTVPNGTVEEMPQFIVGNDGKRRAAQVDRKPEPPQHRMDIDYDDQADSLLEDDDAYDWTEEEPAQDRRPMPTMILATSAKQQDDFTATLQRAKATAPDVFDDLASGKTKMTAGKRELRHREIQDAPPVPSEKYRVIYADPPWHYNNEGTISDSDNYGRAERHYPTMTIEELCDMGDTVKTMSEQNAVLFMWTTSPLLEESFDVINAWGFKYKSSFVWDKVAHNFAHYNSMRHEFLLICTRGSCTPDAKQLLDSVVSIEKSRKHSEKPQEFRTIIDTLYTHGNRIELFARAKHEGWDVWGNQADAVEVEESDVFA